MPAIIAALLGGLISVVGTMAGRVLIALGIGIVTYSGFAAGLDVIKAQAIGGFAGVGVDVLQLLGVLRVGECLSIVFSAVSARLVINGLTGDAVKRWVLK